MENRFYNKALHLTCYFLAFFISNASYAQQKVKKDTIIISLPQAEQQFLTNNLSLIAQKFNISAQKAFVLQAKLYPNPYFNLVQGAYNPQTKKWFQFGDGGEQAAQLSQLIILAHKLNKQVKMAETNSLLAEYSFYDLIRTLKFTLRNDFYAIYYLQRSETVYGEEIRSLEKIRHAFELQRDKGYIARSEVVRIKAQLYNLESELNDLRNQINDRQSELRLVLQSSPGIYMVPNVDTSELLNQVPGSFTVQSLLDSAYQNRTDLLIAKGNKTLSEQNYIYQRSLSVPDLTVGTNYDRAGSYVPDFNAVSLGISIPLFNRNQGNIKAYRNLIDYNDMQLQSTRKIVEEQVYRSLERAIDADRLYQSMDKTFTGEFSQLAKAVFDNYQKRNIGLLDFLNFYDSYKQYIVQMNAVLLNRVSAMENINFVTGTNFFNK